MPQRKTAKKDLRQNKKRHKRNLEIKQNVKDTIKRFKKSLISKDNETKEKALIEVYKVVDKAVSKNILHKNKASRKKSRLTKLSKKTTSKSS
ncbi:MAG: 30S ribosomal protein S20 [Candidatus Omnitrophica bacterium]|nr:30S ribosomal protein S20 [Candidatus Omnitrophota bacterium]